jgi:hypothetical protein
VIFVGKSYLLGRCFQNLLLTCLHLQEQLRPLLPISLHYEQKSNLLPISLDGDLGSARFFVGLRKEHRGEERLIVESPE